MASEESENIQRSVDKICRGEVSNPDWISILELCDLVSSSTTYADETVRSLQSILSQSTDENGVSLALLVTESVLNNCPGFYNHIASRYFLQEIVALVDHPSSAVQERASRMLQVWSTSYPSQPIFHDTYQQLRVQGVAFPTSNRDDFTMGSTDSYEETSSSQMYLEQKPVPAPSPSGLAAELQKLKQDLIAVEEKIKTYRNMLALNITDEDAEDALDFLQQCQPRMNALIEAGLAGKLDEHTLEICLTVNDQLISVLEGTACSSDVQASKSTPNIQGGPDYLSGPLAHLSMTPSPAPRFTNSDAGT